MASMNESCVLVLQYVHQHYNENLTLKEIAQVFFINPAYLGRVFTKQVGMSFAEYLLAYRMEKAMVLLKQKDIKVQDVAHAVGYSNMNYFYRMFREHTGVTPTEYRVDSQKLAAHDYRLDKRVMPEPDETGPEGRVVCRVQSLPDVMGALLSLRNGGLRYYYPAMGEEEPVLMYVDSLDDGTVWSPPKEAPLPEPLGDLCSINALAMLDGSVGLFLLRRLENRLMEMVCLRSYDGGATWSVRPERLHLPESFAMQSSRILRLQSGRLVAPFTRMVVERDPEGTQQVVRHYLSDDDGVTWYSAANVIFTSRHTMTGLRYPTLLETRDGVVRGWVATDMGRQYEYSSWDGGKTATSPLPSNFTSPLAAMHVCHAGEGRLMAVFDPVPDYDTRSGPGLHSRLVYSLSRNDGRGWCRPVVLEENRDGGNVGESPTIYPIQNDMLVAYRAAGTELALRKISMKALMEVAR